MNEADQQAIDAAYAAQIKAIFDGIYTDITMGIRPNTAEFDDLLRRARDGIKRARYVKGILSALLDDFDAD